LPTFEVGDFVLVSDRHRDRLQPYRFEAQETSSAWVRVLHRRREVEGTGKANELVWTEEIVEIPVCKVIRKCRVVEIGQDEEVPVLIDWAAGSLDLFFYRSRVKVERSANGNAIPDSINPKDEPPDTEATQPFGSVENKPLASNISSPESKSSSAIRKLYDIPTENQLRGLDLFCGGGNFGRGVADGGAVQVKWY